MKDLITVFTVLFIHQLIQSGYAAYDVPSITCVCSTTHCLDHGMATCNTTGVCFSQYLDRKDGSHPVVRGCISSKTPLLCENRRPAVAEAPWPVLLCCDSTLCNRDVVPSPPPFKILSDNRNSGPSSEFPETAEGLLRKPTLKEDPPEDQDQNADLPKGQRKNSLLLDMREIMPTNNNNNNNNNNSQGNGYPKIVSPIYVSVLVLGIASLVVIGIVAAIVLRRNNKFYSEQYGALRERNEDYFKQPLDSSSSSRYDDGECSNVIVQNITTQSCTHHHHQPSLSFEPCYHQLDRDIPTRT